MILLDKLSPSTATAPDGEEKQADRFLTPTQGVFFLDLGRGLYMLNLEYKAVVGFRQLLNTTPEKNEKQWDLYTQIYIYDIYTYIYIIYIYMIYIYI